MTQLIRIEVEGEVGLPIRGQRYARRMAFGEIGREWSNNMLPDHFNRNQQQKYRYRNRTEKYLKRKKRAARRGQVKGGGVTDLVYSGRTRDSVSGWNRVRAFPSRATVTLNTPKYIRTRYKPGRPNLANELTTVTPTEVRELDRVGGLALDRATAEWQKKNPVRRRIN